MRILMDPGVANNNRSPGTSGRVVRTNKNKKPCSDQ